MTTLSISNLNTQLWNKNYRSIVKDRELLWQLFCSVEESEFTYFTVQPIDSNTLLIYGDFDVISQFKRFIVQIQDVFIKALKNGHHSSFATVSLNDNIYISPDVPRIYLSDCERFHHPYVINCVLPRFLRMANELNIHINRKIQVQLVLNGFNPIECETARYFINLPDHFKKRDFANDLYALYCTQEMCDLTLMLPQGQVKAHSSILSLYGGPYFKSTLARASGSHVINCTSLYTFKAFLTYVYLGANSFPLLSSDKILDLKELHKFSEFCKLDALSTFCANELNKTNLRLS